MKPPFLTIFLKELRETLREKRNVGLLLLVTLMYPIMIGILMNKIIDRATRTEREGIELAVIGAAKAPTLMAQLKQRNITVHDTAPLDEPAIQAKLQEGKVVGVLRLSDKFSDNYTAMRPARIELWYDSAAEKNGQRREVEEVLEAYGANVASARLLAHGVSPATLAPIEVQRYDTGTNASRSAGLIGSMLSMLFFPAFFCGMSAAVDSTAGERERRSMEVLMAQPARAWEIVTGKWLMAASLAIFGLTLELILAHLVLGWLPLEEIGMAWSLTWFDVAMVCIVALPLSMLAAALQIALAMNAKSFKEAQSVLSIVLMLPLLPGVVVSMMDLKTSLWMYAVPMLSNQTLLRELSKGVELGALPYLLTFISAALPALAIVAFAGWRMKSERYVLAV
ncbi:MULTISPECIES: ABC transporter permease [unclassified Massilia]|uniref:ABC transporter permease n=1 Tax=unclassified Massilia TaxID=2609279 RepID=UPI00177FEA7E|nr:MULTISPECIES: ABC transporter permease [unclassified Massilia]MBD8530640.1 ABC transporter permease [Massilia sp. CFBP 13647]MBD8674865.1 ABC transporter permease [Massilia sp. CFBP 13721]